MAVDSSRPRRRPPRAPASRRALGTRTRRQVSHGTRIALGAVTIGLCVFLAGWLLGPAEPPPSAGLLWITEKTTLAPGAIPAAVRDRALEVADRGIGELDTYVVATRATNIGATDLSVLLDGDREESPDRRRSVINERLDRLGERVDQITVESVGFSLYAALRVLADNPANRAGRVEAWFSTTVFTGSVEPLEIAKLVNADPAAAVDELLTGELSTLDLRHVEVHPVLLTPIGPGQQPLTPASEAWRSAFITQLLTRLGADVATPVHDESTAPAWRNSAQVPPIVPLRDPTPHVTGHERLITIDNIAFIPDTDVLLNPQIADAAIGEALSEYERYQRTRVVDITGHTARFGNAGTARALSAQRAATIKNRLVAHGIPDADIRIHGAGFDVRADRDQPAKSAAQRVVVLRLVPRA